MRRRLTVGGRRGASGRVAFGLAVLSLVVLAAPACAVISPPRPPPPVIVVSVVDPAAGDHVTRADRRLVRQVLAHLARRGAASGRVRAAVVRDAALALELVPRRQAAAPCTSSSWRRAVPALAHAPGLVVVIGGTISGPTPFERRAGLACPGLPGAVLLDRRPVAGVSATVVLLHELGHLAGLVHRAPRRVGSAPALPNVMEEHVDRRAGARPVGLGDVALDAGQVLALARVLRLGPVGEGR